MRPCISLKETQMFMHTMILSHITYCAIIWGQASQSAVNPNVIIQTKFKSNGSEPNEMAIRTHSFLYKAETMAKIFPAM